MKRIINGMTYNTDTATIIGRASFVEEATGARAEERRDFTLYQTRGGAFFELTSVSTYRKNIHGGWEPVERHEFDPKTREQAQAWVSEDGVELLSNVLGEPPEASEEVSKGATIYLRVPASLKDIIEADAKEDDLSVNSYAIRCMERCSKMDQVGARLGEILATGLAERSEPTNGFFSDATFREMVQHMHEQAEAAASLLGWSGKDLENLSTDAGHSARGHQFHRHWKYDGPAYNE